MLRSLPQVEGLGWGDFYIDKEFLFHQVTGLAYLAAGERGVVGASLLLSALAALAFLWFASRRLPPLPAVALSFAIFFCPYLNYRMLLLRPHTLAIPLFLLANLFLISRRPLPTLLASTAFTLSYHAFYLPIACFAWMIALVSFEPPAARARWRKAAWAGGFGCLCGVLLNPYFPANVLMAAVHARIPSLLKGELRNLSFGSELYPASSDLFLEIFYLPLAALALGLFFLGRPEARAEEGASDRRIQLLYLVGICGLFFLLATQTKRVGEYLLPLSGVLLVVLLEGVREWKARYSAALVLLAGAQSLVLYRSYSDRRPAFGDTRVQRTFAAIAAIPQGPEGGRVFNCEWDRTPYLLYARPDLHFVDILDPSFLYFANRGAFRAREELLDGTVGDASGLIGKAFRADYVLCNQAEVVAQLADDPAFRKVYPGVGDPIDLSPAAISVFAVRKKEVSQFVASLDVSFLGPVRSEELSKVAARGPRRTVEPAPSTYLSFEPLLAQSERSEKGARPKGDFHCALVSPSRSEMERLAGAELLGLGGGAGFHLRLNGRPLFRSRSGFPRARAIQVLVPLPAPLRASDRLEALVCSPPDFSYWGVSLSLWKAREVAELCAEKGLAHKGRDEWRMQGMGPRTCLGPLAVPDAPIRLRAVP